MMNLQEFYKMLENHDWFHMMSDDGRVDRAGSAARARLNDLASGWPEAKALLNEYHNYVWSQVRGPELPKPVRPE